MSPMCTMGTYARALCNIRHTIMFKILHNLRASFSFSQVHTCHHKAKMKDAIVLSVLVILMLAGGKCPDVVRDPFCYPKTIPATAPIQPSPYCFQLLTTNHPHSLSSSRHSPSGVLFLFCFHFPPLPTPFGFLLAYYTSYPPRPNRVSDLPTRSHSPGYIRLKLLPIALFLIIPCFHSTPIHYCYMDTT